ncbi:LOW QUALITY PROTEIN: D-beta-hydroxybutyrate dehydrogenase, mitochondrial-like [Microcaecilia unicolor]|uniref:LOW QUALITY PROTEIN: D-beta-hydroxybutyrate dehydrogenase, mitochondrial-like n=1 Tax=Microcaecilia unicolor TaxID=1415580 RepID=A0A6P7Z7E4_9AMPH|nr:LOW QUALITY PROTEIN: D-beta-hydroxybutyrate dehydrogenase, mitochondrial-like [Microcaecilia unicolor]
MAPRTLSLGKMALLVLFSLVLTLALGMGLPEGLSFFARLFGFTESSVTYGIVLLYLVYVLYVAVPALPRGTVPVEGKHVLITGCDTGFGFALAKHLHAIGFTVFAGCLLKDKGGDGATELKSMQSDRMKVLQLNVTSDEEVAQAVEFVKKNLKEPERGLWGVVNNAGVSGFGDIEFASLDNYKELADVNLWGTVRVTKAFLPLIRRAKGRVVNIASMLGRMAVPSRSCYSISKYGVEAFSDCLRQEMYRWGVKVAVIEPSNFVAATGILTRERVEIQADKLWKEASEIVQEDYGKDYFAHQVVLMKSFLNSGLKDMSLVLNDITDALSSKFPYTRYNPSDTYWWVRLILTTHLPAAIADWIYIH